MNIIPTKNIIPEDESKPVLQIGEKLYPVDNTLKTWKKIKAIQEDPAIANKDDKILELALGRKNFKELSEMELTVQGYNDLTYYVMAAITGTTYDELKEKAKNQ